MTRLFQEHEVRKIISCNPMWNMKLLDTTEGAEEVMKMPVPGCWETHPALASYRGRAEYTQNIRFGGNVRLVFKGVSHTAEVYVDGTKVAQHYNAYTPFSVLLTGMENEAHEMKIVVDNSFNENSSLHMDNDYYSYGGITRPFEIQQIKGVYIHHIEFTPRKTDLGWKVIIKILLCNVENEKHKISLVEMLDKEVFHYSQDIVLQPKQELIYQKEFEFSDIREYMLNNPKLYLLNTIIRDENNNLLDDLTDRIGFREITVQGKDIFFNGKKLYLKGVNRHEDYAEFGCAVPLEAMYRDIEMIKDLGANCIRTSHYPNDERFLDLCDEYGILVWEEAHARALTEEQMRHPRFDEQSENCIREMVETHYNHPSIFVWGVLNECASNTEYGKKCYDKQISRLRELDKSRPTTYASCHIGDDICMDLPDIVSYNMYPLWYHEEDPKEYLAKVKDYIKSAGGNNKPIIISEIGAGAIYGYRSSTRTKWTEERQADILEKQLEAVISDEGCAGVFVWQFADCRVCEGHFSIRPKCQNNKGIVDIYRREKLAYQRVKEMFHKYIQE